MDIATIVCYSLPVLFVAAFAVMILRDERAQCSHEPLSLSMARLRASAGIRRSGKRRRSISGKNVADLFPGPQNVRRG